MVESTEGRVAVKDSSHDTPPHAPSIRESFGQHILDVTLEAIRRKWNSNSTSSSTTSSRNPSRSGSRSNSNNNSSEEESEDEGSNVTTLKPRQYAIEGGVMVCEDNHNADLLEGCMKKHGGVLGAWHERYFVLKPEERQIMYYKKKRHYLEKRKPRGVIDLRGAFAKRKNDDEDREHVFVIFYPDEMDSIFYLQASCEQQITQWVSVINQLNKDCEAESEHESDSSDKHAHR